MIDFFEISDIFVEKFKFIKVVLDLELIFDEEIFKLFNWVLSYYYVLIGEVLISVLFVKFC